METDEENENPFQWDMKERLAHELYKSICEGDLDATDENISFIERYGRTNGH